MIREAKRDHKAREYRHVEVTGQRAEPTNDIMQAAADKRARKNEQRACAAAQCAEGKLRSREWLEGKRLYYLNPVGENHFAKVTGAMNWPPVESRESFAELAQVQESRAAH